MKMAAAAVILALLLGGCKEQPPVFDSKSVMVRWVDSAAQDAQFESRMALNYFSLLKELHEKPLDSAKHVTYIFQLTLPYSQHYRFRIEQQPDSQFVLYSKAFGGATSESHLKDSIPYRTITAPGNKSRLIEESQAFSQAEFDTFKNTLEGSYYWTWEYPYPDIGSINEGPFWTLSSRDYLPQHGDTLVSHSNDAGRGVYGSFTRACLYLVQRSKLLKRLPYLAAYTKYFLANRGDPHNAGGNAIAK